MPVDGEDFTELDDVPIAKISREEVFKAAVKTQNGWKDNMEEENYRSTGEAIESVTIEPQMQGADEYTVGSNKIQVLIGEVGRAPGSFPNVDQLGEWVHEQAGLPDKGDADFDNAVYNIGKHIAENGLPAYRFGTRAFREVSQELEAELEQRFAEEWDE